MPNTTNTPLCNHRFLDDHICGSPALRGELYCYHHHPTRRPTNPTELYARRARRGFNLPAPQTRQQLQHALSQVIQRLAANQLDVHRAGLLLYSLQIAASALPPG